MAEEAGSVLVTDICHHRSKVKQSLTSRSNMDKMLKEDAMHAVSEMDSLLNKLNGMLLGLESTLKNALKTREKLQAKLV